MSADPTALLSREELGALLNSARDSVPAQPPRQVGAPESLETRG